MPRKQRSDLRGQSRLPRAQEGSQGRAEAPDEKPPKEPQGAVLGSTRSAALGSYAVVGIDTSLTSIAACAYGFDGLTKKTSVTHGEIRWAPEVDYFARLGQAAKSHDLVLDLLRKLWVIDPSRVFVAMEEPIPLGMLGRGANFQASFAKQQIEVAGCVKGSLVRYGFANLVEVGNSAWKKVLRERCGVEYLSVPRGSSQAQKQVTGLANKMATKAWAINTLGLPDLPDLVKSRSGAKVPRPEHGYGAHAKAVQPNDIYDAAGVCVWFLDDLDKREVVKWPSHSKSMGCSRHAQLQEPLPGVLQNTSRRSGGGRKFPC